MTINFLISQMSFVPRLPFSAAIKTPISRPQPSIYAQLSFIDQSIEIVLLGEYDWKAYSFESIPEISALDHIIKITSPNFPILNWLDHNSRNLKYENLHFIVLCANKSQTLCVRCKCGITKGFPHFVVVVVVVFLASSSIGSCPCQLLL